YHTNNNRPQNAEQKADVIAGRVEETTSKLAHTVMLVLALTGAALTSTSCGGGDEPTPIEQTTLTPEQQAFADLLAPNADGSLKSATDIIGEEPYNFND